MVARVVILYRFNCNDKIVVGQMVGQYGDDGSGNVW